MSLSLARAGGDVKVVAAWPRSNCGAYLLELRSSSRAPVLMKVTVEPRKFGRTALESMIVDLKHRLPISLAVGLAKDSGVTSAALERTLETSVAQELALLRRLLLGDPGVLGILESLRQVSRDPHRVLAVEKVWREAGLARRPAPDRLFLALVKPGNLVAHVPSAVVDDRVRITYDLVENRLIVSVVRRVDERLSRLLSVSADSSPIIEEVGQLLRRLRASVREASFLAEVSELSEPIQTISMVLQRRVPYRSFLRASVELARHLIVRPDLSALDAPLENVPALYEAWGCLSALDELQRVCQERGLTVVSQNIVSRGVYGWFTKLVQGASPVAVFEGLGVLVRAWYQLRLTKSTSPRSLSYSQIPDLTIQFASSQNNSFVVIDPKYKLVGDGTTTSSDDELPEGTPQKADLDKMHAYRDAIRQDMDAVVVFAGILYPGRTCLYPVGAEAAGAAIGAIKAIPGRGDDQLAPLRAVFHSQLKAAAREPSMIADLSSVEAQGR